MTATNNDKVDVVHGVEYRYSSDWIHELESEEHWRLYWRQQHLMDKLVTAGDHVLEIGVGSGFTANYLRTKGITVTTLDIDPAKRPDIVANIVTYDFSEPYAAILAFEVFEHIPYAEFCSVLDRVGTAATGYLFLSVPRNRRTVCEFSLKLPKLKRRSIRWDARIGRIRESHHFWELDCRGITPQSLESDFAARRFDVERREEAFNRLFYALKSRIEHHGRVQET